MRLRRTRPGSQAGKSLCTFLLSSVQGTAGSDRDRGGCWPTRKDPGRRTRHAGSTVSPGGGWGCSQDLWKDGTGQLRNLCQASIKQEAGICGEVRCGGRARSRAA